MKKKKASISSKGPSQAQFVPYANVTKFQGHVLLA